jgi:hypothetical protein
MIVQLKMQMITKVFQREDNGDEIGFVFRSDFTEWCDLHGIIYPTFESNPLPLWLKFEDDSDAIHFKLTWM